MYLNAQKNYEKFNAQVKKIAKFQEPSWVKYDPQSLLSNLCPNHSSYFSHSHGRNPRDYTVIGGAQDLRRLTRESSKHRVEQIIIVSRPIILYLHGGEPISGAALIVQPRHGNFTLTAHFNGFNRKRI